MKKILCAVMAIIMLMTMTTTAFAANWDDGTDVVYNGLGTESYTVTCVNDTTVNLPTGSFTYTNDTITMGDDSFTITNNGTVISDPNDPSFSFILEK